MKQIKPGHENCAHESFVVEFVNATGTNKGVLALEVPIVRCTDCGKAIGSFLPPSMLDGVKGRLDSLEKAVQSLNRRSDK